MKSSLWLPALLFAFPLQATPENPLVPATWFQEITATDGSTQHSVVFTTVPGVEYTFFHSHDLVEWTEIGKTYGLGHEFAAAMFETAPAPPPPDPENPPATPPAFTHASVTIQPSSGAAGGTVVSWASLDHGNAVNTLIPGNMAAAWQTVPLFAAAHGNHHFFIIHTTGDAAPPVENPQLDDMDAAMIADLEAGWAGFNTAVATSAETARDTPPPPPALDARGFWRIKADWSLDSDNDGSPDHLEFALAAQAPGADGLAGNPFNADTNNDGIPDGEQLDSDGDGIPDAQDIAPGDGGVAYSIVPLPRYAMFTFTDNAPDNAAFAINDRGTVLFPNKVWKAGEFQNLINDQSQIPGYPLYPDGDPVIRARAINDNDQIIGSGYGFHEEHAQGIDSPYFFPILHWPSPAAVPQVVSSTNGTVKTYADLWDERYVTHLDNLGNFFSISLIWDSERTTIGPEMGEWKKWTLPFGGNPLTSALAADFSKGTAPGGIVWGSEYDHFGPWQESRITAPFNVEIPMEPRDILAQGDSGILIAITASPNASTVIRKENGQWRISPLLADALDIADNGTAIRKRVYSRELAPAILLNGKWTSLERAVPGLPERWKTSPTMSFSDTSPGGWILAYDRPGHPVTPDDISAALLPMRLKGRHEPDPQGSPGVFVEEAVGVDDFSIGSSDPGLSPDGIDHVQDRIWIMAPKGADKTVVLNAPLGNGTELDLSATGVRFDGQSHANCASRSSSFTIRAQDEFLDGDSDLMLDIGDGTFSTPAANTPVRIKRMKARTVNVSVFKFAEELTPGGTVFQPEHLPARADLEKYLNNVYGPQINVTFNVYLEPVLMTTPIDSDANGLFDSSGAGHSADQAALSTLAGPGIEGTHIRVFMLGTHKVIGETGIGIASTDNNTCWVKALALISGGDPDVEKARVCATTAHEIGHLLFGAGHPSNNPENLQGAAPLPGTNHSKRLMRDGNNNPRGHDHLIVKAEWDKAEEWLEDEIDRPETP